MLGSLVEFEWLFPINRNRRIRHCLFHCLIENTLTLLHVFQIDEIQYIVVLFAILILDGTEFPATFVFLDEIRIESDELADFLLRHRKRNMRSMFEAFMWLRTSRANLLRSIRIIFFMTSLLY